MSQTMTRMEFNQEGFEAFLQTRSEPTWLTDLRKSAWTAFSNGSWPTQRDEEWMRTDIRLFKLDKFGLASENTSPLPQAVLSEGVELAGSCPPWMA